MTELIRPALYEAQHMIKALVNSEEKVLYTVVGPICESSDIFAKDIALRKVQRGDYLVIYTAGAYGKVLSSEYNLRPAVKEYLI